MFIGYMFGLIWFGIKLGYNNIITPHEGSSEWFYSRGQPKPSKKNGKLMMAEKMIGKHANRLSEARGQFSS